MVELDREIPSPVSIGTDVIAIPEGEPLSLQVRLESVMEGVLVSGELESLAKGGCVRCLEPVEVPVDVTFQELYAYPDRAAHHREVGADDDEEQRVLESDLIDLEPLLRDAVVPALPFQPVCSDECPGLCSECGALLADDPAHGHDIIDPRWAALTDLASEADPAKPSPSENEKRN